jgi:hypothetical protein
MTRQVPRLPLVFLVGCLLLGLSLSVPADDDDAPARNPPAAEAGADGAQPSLDAEQQHAVGIVVARPVTATAPQRIDALGLVLDTTTLISDQGEADAAAAAEQSASAELVRLRALREGGAGASLKMIEAAQAEQARARAQARTAALRFAVTWAPLAALPGGPRQKLIEAAATGHSLLLRADLPGRHTLGALPDRALLDVDGIQIPGRVLGVLRQTTELQSVGLLLELPDVPAGLGAGARVPVSLFMAARSGFIVPRDAVLYDENGPYVYRQSKPAARGQPAAGPGDATGSAIATAAKQAAGAKQATAAQHTAETEPAAGAHKASYTYTALKISLLQPYGDGWLVTGIDGDDDIVVRGAGVLWSLQGVGAHAVADDDD